MSLLILILQETLPTAHLSYQLQRLHILLLLVHPLLLLLLVHQVLLLLKLGGVPHLPQTRHPHLLLEGRLLGLVVEVGGVVEGKDLVLVSVLVVNVSLSS